MTTGRINQVTILFVARSPSQGSDAHAPGSRGKPPAPPGRRSLRGVESPQKSKPTHHARGTRPAKALVPPNADASTLFPVLTRFRSNLPLQRIWDHGLQRGLPSKRGLVNQGPIPRRIPKRLHAQQVWPSASNPHPFQRHGRSSQKEATRH